MKKPSIYLSVKLLIVIVLLNGCASARTANELRSSAALTKTIDVEVNYQLAHERILNKFYPLAFYLLIRACV